MKTPSSHKKGFTLTEMLIVILIIALLMAFIIPQLLKGPAAARDATRVNRVNEIAAALEAYRSAKGVYPEANGSTCIDSLKDELKSFISEAALADPDQTHKVGNTCTGSFGYKTFEYNGQANNAFVVLTQLEADKKGNINVSDISSISASTTLTRGVGTMYAKLSF